MMIDRWKQLLLLGFVRLILGVFNYFVGLLWNGRIKKSARNFDIVRIGALRPTSFFSPEIEYSLLLIFFFCKNIMTDGFNKAMNVNQVEAFAFIHWALANIIVYQSTPFFVFVMQHKFRFWYIQSSYIDEYCMQILSTYRFIQAEDRFQSVDCVTWEFQSTHKWHYD